MNNYLNEQELNAVKGLMHYLNTSMDPKDGGATLSPDVALFDSNGERCGNIAYNANEGAYVLVLV